MSVCVSFCEENYWKSNEPILLKLGVMIRPTNQKNWLTFGGAPVPDMDSGSHFHFLYHCGIGDFRRFISISHTVTAQFFYETWRNNWHRQGNDSTHNIYAEIRQTSGSGLIRQSGFESRITFGWNFVVAGGLRCLSAVLFYTLNINGRLHRPYLTVSRD